MIIYAKIDLPVHINDLQNEFMRVKEGARWLPHFNTYYYEGSWDVLSLRSPGGKDEGIIPDLMNEEGYKDTLLMEDFPGTKTFLETLNCEVMSVRFLNLKPGAIIKPHRDEGLSFENGEARIHIPIFTNSHVRFIVEDDVVEMKEGECWYINANRKHSVSNNGSTDRIHLVVDCLVNQWLKDIFDCSDKVTVADEENNDIENIIKELRFQNTETSNLIADRMERERGIK